MEERAIAVRPPPRRIVQSIYFVAADHAIIGRYLDVVGFRWHAEDGRPFAWIELLYEDMSRRIEQPPKHFAYVHVTQRTITEEDKEQLCLAETN